MRVSFYGYRVVAEGTAKDRKAGMLQNYLVDLRTTIQEFVRWKGPRYKNHLSYHGEPIFLLPLSPPVYLFVMARDRELVKALQTEDLTVQDIRKRLHAKESVGFASYVMIDRNMIGVAAKTYAPRAKAFLGMMNQILMHARMPYVFDLQALTHTVPPDEVGLLRNVRSVALTVDAASDLGKAFWQQIGGRDHRVLVDANTFEIVIKAKRGEEHSIDGVLRSTLSVIGGAGVTKVKARAQMDIEEAVLDLYIVGAGGIGADLGDIDERHVPGRMVEEARNNRILQEKLREFTGGKGGSQSASASSLGLDWADIRPRLLDYARRLEKPGGAGD